MPNLNKCTFMGHLGRDPEVKYMASGDAVANVSLAVSEKWKDKNGEKQERTEWVNLVAYKRTAEVMGEYLHKGSPVYVEGKMQTRKWQDKEGNDRYTTEIVVREMQMLGGKQEGRQAEQKKAPVNSQVDEDFNDEIPF